MVSTEAFLKKSTSLKKDRMGIHILPQKKLSTFASLMKKSTAVDSLGEVS
jgi:hypothetical protein